MPNDKRKSVTELNAELELLAEHVKSDANDAPDKVQEKLNGIEEIVKSYDKKIDDLERELLQARHNNTIDKDNDSKGTDGEVCDKKLLVKPNLKERMRRGIPKLTIANFVKKLSRKVGRWKNTWNTMGTKDLLNAVFAIKDFI